jgi:hypothetical protein
MFFSGLPGLEQLDPALLAFVKCHVTSPLKWEALRALASQSGVWVSASQLARATHKGAAEMAAATAELAAEGVVEELRVTPDDVSYRLPLSEPTSVVLHRLIDETMHSQELRAIIAGYMLHNKHMPPSASAAA